MTKLQVQIDIDAPIATVWQILTDFARYPEWNRFTRRVECDSIVGNPVTVYAYLTPEAQQPRETHLQLRTFEAPQRLCWGSDAWYLRVHRCQELTVLDEGLTRYTNWETFEGLLAPLVMATQRANLLAAYQLCAENLKVRAENTIS
jgi:hypothetical protein